MPAQAGHPTFLGEALRGVRVSRNSSHLDSFALKDLMSPHGSSGQVLQLTQLHDEAEFPSKRLCLFL